MFCGKCNNFIQSEIIDNKLIYICDNCDAPRREHVNGEVYLSVPIIHNMESSSDRDLKYIESVKKYGKNTK